MPQTGGGEGCRVREQGDRGRARGQHPQRGGEKAVDEDIEEQIGRQEAAHGVFQRFGHRRRRQHGKQHVQRPGRQTALPRRKPKVRQHKQRGQPQHRRRAQHQAAERHAEQVVAQAAGESAVRARVQRPEHGEKTQQHARRLRPRAQRGEGGLGAGGQQKQQHGEGCAVQRGGKPFGSEVHNYSAFAAKPRIIDQTRRSFPAASKRVKMPPVS